MAPPGTLDRTPPPFFRQGASAHSRLALCTALAVFLMVADVRLGITQPLRAALATLLLPVQKAVAWPVRAWQGMSEYGGGVQALIEDNESLRRQLAAQAERITRADRLQAENEQLRALLELRNGAWPEGRPAEILFELADRYSRRIMIDRGSQQGLALAAPVINERGLLGQITRLYPYTAEVTLLQDPAISVPVLNARTRLRGVAFGDGNEGSGMELRFVAANADVQVGDELITSGLDGVYPAGLPVARVTAVQRQGETSFARIDLAALAPADGLRHILVLPLNRAGEKSGSPESAARSQSAASRPAKDGGRR